MKKAGVIRPLKLSEKVLLRLGVCEEASAIDMAKTFDADPRSVYAAMSGMQTHSRRWIEPARTVPTRSGLRPRVGRGALYMLTAEGRAQEQWVRDNMTVIL